MTNDSHSFNINLNNEDINSHNYQTIKSIIKENPEIINLVYMFLDNLKHKSLDETLEFIYHSNTIVANDITVCNNKDMLNMLHKSLYFLIDLVYYSKNFLNDFCEYKGWYQFNQDFELSYEIGFETNTIYYKKGSYISSLEVLVYSSCGYLYKNLFIPTCYVDKVNIDYDSDFYYKNFPANIIDD